MADTSLDFFPAPEGFLTKLSLRGTREGLIRELPGFSREQGHRIPEAPGPSSEAFVQKIGHPLVLRETSELFQQIRRQFGYRRKEISYQEGEGMARLGTPAFRVDQWVELHTAEWARYVLCTEVEWEAEKLSGQEESLLEVFRNRCREVYVEFNQELDLIGLIDRIEERAAWREALEYPPDAGSFQLTLGQPPVILRAQKQRLVFAILPGGDLEELWRGSQMLMRYCLNGSID